MTMRLKRVVLLAVVIACGVGGWGAWQASKPSPSVEALRKPWIGLPGIVMDAGSPHVRTALTYGSDSRSDLSRLCGSHFYAGMEKYTAHLGDYALQPGDQQWRIELEVHDDGRIHALITDHSWTPPPPKDCQNCTQSTFDRTKLASAWFDKAELEPIAQAWRDPRLWEAPQTDPVCMDGIPAFVEACVEGRYAAFNRNCDVAGMAAAYDLWKTVQHVLPAPR